MESLYTMPGFVNDLMAHIRLTARYPNEPLAFAAALSMLSFLTGGRVQSQTGLRTNVMIMGLADSGVGKDDGRKAILNLMDQTAMDPHYVARFGSGEAIQDALLEVRDDPRILCVTDEVSYMLNRIKSDRTGTQDMLISELLQIYSASQSIYKTRTLAGRPGERVNQPHLAFYGTATPERFYEAISNSMAEGGLVARLIIIEAGKRGQKNRECRPRAIPDELIDYARYWSGMPREEVPPFFHMAQAADAMQEDVDSEFTVAYETAQAARDAAGMSIWARASEMATKLAMLRSVSRDRESRTLFADDVEWAGAFVQQHSSELHWQCTSRVANSDFHAKQQKMLRLMDEAPAGVMRHSEALRRMHVSAKEMGEIVGSLVESGQIAINNQTRPREYVLVG